QDELRENVRTVLAGDCPPSLVRAVFEGTGTAAKLWDRMVELYWPGLAVPEADGGSGLTFGEVCLVCAELGRAVAPAPFLATVTQFAALVQEACPAGARARFLGPVLEEGRTGTLAFAEDGRWTLDAVATTARPDGDAWVLDGAKTAVFDGAGA